MELSEASKHLSKLLERVGATGSPIADCVAGDGHQPRRPTLWSHRAWIEPRFPPLRRRKSPRKITGVPIRLPLPNPNGIIITSVGSNVTLATPATAALSSITGRRPEHATHSSSEAAYGGGGRV